MAYGLYQRIFNETDRNHDGVLDRNEFRNFVNFEVADRNHDGRITLPEFASGGAQRLGIRPQQAAQAFHVADTNHDGVLSRSELANFSNFQRADLNHDGRIDPYELRHYLGSQHTIPGYQPHYYNGNTNYNSYKTTYTTSSYAHY